MKKALVWLLPTLILFGSVLSFNTLVAQDNLKEVRYSIDVKTQDSKIKIETIVNLLKGVSDAEYDLKTKTLTVHYDDSEIQEEMIRYTLQTIGFFPKKIDSIIKPTETKNSTKDAKDSTRR